MEGKGLVENESKPWALADLPPFPGVAMQVLRLLSVGDVRLSEVSDLIQSDTAFSAQILRLANSPLFGFHMEIKSILQVTALLGVERIKKLAVTAGIQGHFRAKVPALGRCWRHSLACAIIAEELGQASSISAGFAYTAALLHDIGRLALMTAQPTRYAELVALAEKSPFDVLEREREWFGNDHCRTGWWLIENWRLPQVFGKVAALHHVPPLGDEFDIVALVRAACQFADALGFAAVRPLAPRTVEDIMMELPGPERERFSRSLGQLGADIEATIHSLE